MTTPHFYNGPIINGYESSMWELLELLLQPLNPHYRCCPQIALELMCARDRNHYLQDSDLWKFWVSAKVDFAILDRSPGSDSKAHLAIECQSHYHDDPDRQSNDRKKAQLLAWAGIPLLYIRPLDQDYRYYRFYTPTLSHDLCYNLITQSPQADLQTLLQDLLTSPISANTLSSTTVQAA
ncbi:DUF2726 domain-containing protein [Prochlorothrix hollandica]|uniref:DUF2726 domain-containing protein n=1 Tax=Prochlorothrix hollandica PCC 9006 = CALU 1027 TaxID=317619 RepID=A0A0M2PTP6_PROHO|nr:DUF2726 domain-containing protein [Prochlorothrix hollandica]KKI99494.1 hypothetical protein PROH_12935 [Prochlorothrix hollandica PCC 9006 = CALU 1027]